MRLLCFSCTLSLLFTAINTVACPGINGSFKKVSSQGSSVPISLLTKEEAGVFSYQVNKSEYWLIADGIERNQRDRKSGKEYITLGSCSGKTLNLLLIGDEGEVKISIELIHANLLRVVTKLNGIVIPQGSGEYSN
jgi:hypothetical protein